MEKKMRHSKQREMIYDYLLSTKEHPSAEMIYGQLKSEMPNLSLGTVYRNLKLLEEMGKVRKVATTKNTDRYDACCDDHAHYVCEECGTVKDLEDLNFQAVRESCHLEPGDKIHWVNVTIGGICSDCANKKKQ